ncbi:hypothetical protein [Vandammella animalimorsus]|uniref:hypothetical protein n=1 Tax=Vandammella animalimorsus TaxID=2029117 RepID=UPI001EED1840|nr:hypothetical protein [Vandammella animalimorsus]
MPEHQFVAKSGFDYERGEKWIETQKAPIRDIDANPNTRKLCFRAADHLPPKPR